MKHRPYGVVLGRFQPLHIGHMEYLEAARQKCHRLVVGITNPDVRSLTSHEADPNRSKTESNPFSYFLRHQMIEQSLRDAGWLPGAFTIVPAEVTDMCAAAAFLPQPEKTTFFVTIYDAWGEEKAKRLSELGFAVETLWRRSMYERVTSGTDIRRRMRDGCMWRHLVPGGVVVHLERSELLTEDGRLNF